MPTVGGRIKCKKIIVLLLSLLLLSSPVSAAPCGNGIALVIIAGLMPGLIRAQLVGSGDGRTLQGADMITPFDEAEDFVRTV